MKIAVIGTGMVGRALAARLAGLGHDVVIGTRDVAETLARTEPDWLGNPPYAQWQETQPQVRLFSFADAGAFGEVVINATSGAASLAALDLVGADNLAGKPLLDLALPLDMSEGMPPKLLVANDDSLGEQIQRAFPAAKLVKTLTPVLADIMVDPQRLDEHHTLFLAGDDEQAKATITELLVAFGWPQEDLVDLGGVTGSRAIEMYARLFFTLVGVYGDFNFSIAVVRNK